MHHQLPILKVTGLMMLFLACLVMVVSTQFILIRSNELIANGFVIKACIGVKWQGGIRFGLGWYWPWMAYGLGHKPPFYGAPIAHHMICAFMPWLPILPSYGT